LKGTVNWCLSTALVTVALVQLWQTGSVEEEGECCGRTRSGRGLCNVLKIWTMLRHFDDNIGVLIEEANDENLKVGQ
jgi:hypothetical protein